MVAGASGTHSICVCITHQNVKLMYMGSNLKSLSGGEIPDYKTCLAALRCSPATTECFLGNCSECPGSEKLREAVLNIMDANLIDTVEFRQWMTTDRANLETKVLPIDDFIDCFILGLEKLQVHDFIAKMQSSFAAKKKETLQPGEYLVVADFSENYSAVIQDEIQSYHTQTTIHPFVCYYKGDDGSITNTCFIVISECTDHNTAAVHLFQRKLITFLTAQSGKLPSKVMYLSDGCAAQYLKNFNNLCHHIDDFGVLVEWHFFATSHGKTAGDGAAGTLKRLATKSSLQRPYTEQIITPRQLYNFAC